METIDNIVRKAVSRRNFLAGAGTLSAAAVLAGCSTSNTAATTTTTTTTTTVKDSDILNFALNLEYLEAEFYLHAATGKGLQTADIGASPGAVTGGSQVPNLTAAQQAIINEIAFDEQTHVQVLRKTLGSAAVDRPAIDLTFFGPLAVAAKIETSATAYSPFADFNSFLVGAFIFEDVGVTAYHGAAGLISDAGLTNGTLAAAAGILAVEAYHAAYVRTTLTGLAVLAAQASPATAYPYLGFANQVATLRASLGNGMETPLVVPTSVSTPSAVVAADANAIAYARTTDEVLHIVYGSPTVGVAKGGFFPNGINSILSTTKS